MYDLIAAASLICFVLGLIWLPKTKKTLLLAITSLTCFALVNFVYSALWFGSNISAGEAMAVLFLIIFVPSCFPAFAGAGFLLRWIAERLLRRPIPGRTFLPWVVPIAFLIPYIATEVSNRSTPKIFQKLVADDVPRSLADFQYYWWESPMDYERIAIFRLDPSEFGKVLSRQKLQETSSQTDIQPALVQLLREIDNLRAAGCGISLPKTSLAHMYAYSAETEGGQQMMYVFTNDAHDTAVVFNRNLN